MYSFDAEKATQDKRAVYAPPIGELTRFCSGEILVDSSEKDDFEDDIFTLE